MSRNWNIDRRTFLRGAAGALVPLPFLNLMESSADAGERNLAGEVKPPVRFMTLFKPNGVHPPSWNINGGTENDFRMSPLMAPFAKHKDDVLILDNMGDFGFSSSASFSLWIFFTLPPPKRENWERCLCSSCSYREELRNRRERPLVQKPLSLSSNCCGRRRGAVF